MMRARATFLVLFTAAVALAASATAAAAAKEYVLKHPKHEHCKSHYVKKTKTVRRKVNGHVVTVRETVCIHSSAAKPAPSPSTGTAKLEECTTTVSGGGPMPETQLYYYQVILGCYRGEFSSFQVSTNRTIAAGSVTAQISPQNKYTCTQPSTTSLSCTGVNLAVPSEGAAVRVFFKSTQPPCEGSSPESVTIATEGETFAAKIGEAQGGC